MQLLISCYSLNIMTNDVERFFTSDEYNEIQSSSIPASPRLSRQPLTSIPSYCDATSVPVGPNNVQSHDPPLHPLILLLYFTILSLYFYFFNLGTVDVRVSGLESLVSVAVLVIWKTLIPLIRNHNMDHVHKFHTPN